MLALDISDPDAGVGGGNLLGDPDAVCAALDVNFWGTLSMMKDYDVPKMDPADVARIVQLQQLLGP